jgi:hypothetical protein
LLAGGLGLAQTTPAAHLASLPLDRNAREVFDQAMALFDQSFDPAVNLVLHPNDGGHHVTGRYMVRESSWYALGLLMRNHPGDGTKAQALLSAVLAEQYLTPGVKWYGTFKRSPEEPGPAAGDRSFTSYDPNWREFIGTIFEIVLIEYPARLPAELKTRMYAAIDAAIGGEIHDGRLVPSYSNIALMYGALWDFAAAHDSNRDWRTQSAAWTAEVYRLFRQHNAFNEYNAPTYYGVDLYGLALWREYGSTEAIRSMGRTMEASLWDDIALFYQPEMRNLAGPYDRTYGMDMSRYVTPTGVWTRTVLDAGHAALPAHPTLATFQVADMWFAPQIVLLRTRIPASALTRLHTFAGPHLVDRQIDTQRRATAWVGSRAMWGGEFTGLTKETGTSQFHPATAHWIMPGGEIGWIEVTKSPKIDAIADRGGLRLTTDGDIVIRILGGPALPALSEKTWKLPGLEIAIDDDAKSFAAARSPDCDECMDLTYTGLHAMRLTMKLDARR